MSLIMRWSCLFGVALPICATFRPAWGAEFNTVGLYQSTAELAAWARHFESANPDIVHLVEFGQSSLGQPLLALQITTEAGINHSAKPEFLFTAGLHAREVIGSEAAYRLADYLVQGFRSQSPEFQDILSEREVWIVPLLNPDGRLQVEAGASRHRKNMELFPGQKPMDYTRGVDLNRNFPHRWSSAPNLASDEVYRGPSVLSAPEASSLWSLLHDPNYFDQLWGAIDFHSGIESIMTPWLSYDEFVSDPLPANDRSRFDRLALGMHDATGFTTDRLQEDFYGSLADSLYEEFGTIAFIEEIYVGPSGAFPDFFAWFNPLDAATKDDRIKKAIDSSMFLLSDEAFPIVPEPTSIALAIVGMLVMLADARRLRPGKRVSAAPQGPKSPAAVNLATDRRARTGDRSRMRTMGKAARYVAFVLLASSLSSGACPASVIYDYVGHPFDFAQLPYKSADRLRGYVEFATAPDALGELQKSDVLDYRFTAGDSVWTSTHPTSWLTFDFLPDGELAEWSVLLFGSGAVPSSMSRDHYVVPLSRGDILATSADGIVALSLEPGVWTRRAVPEPTGGALLWVAVGLWADFGSRKQCRSKVRAGAPKRKA